MINAVILFKYIKDILIIYHTIMNTKMKWVGQPDLIYNNKYNITLELSDTLVLPNKQVKYMTSNKKYWWIKNNFGSQATFIEMAQVEGNKVFKMDIKLSKGNYTIGCGTHKNGIRKDFRVLGDEYIIII